MTAQEICRYRGYEIVPRREWSKWCVSIYPSRPDLPILSKSTLRTLAEAREDALSETKPRIDRLLSSLEEPRLKQPRPPARTSSLRLVAKPPSSTKRVQDHTPGLLNVRVRRAAWLKSLPYTSMPVEIGRFGCGHLISKTAIGPSLLTSFGKDIAIVRRSRGW